MNDVLGALDVLESHIMAAKNVPFSQNVIVNEQEVLDMVDKIRQLLLQQSSGKSVDSAKAFPIKKNPKEMANDIVLAAEKEAAQLAFESRQYADDIFVRLQVMVAKLRKNLVRLDQNIEEGREMLENLEEEPEQAVNDQDVKKEISHEQSRTTTGQTIKTR